MKLGENHISMNFFEYTNIENASECDSATQIMV